MRSVMALSMYLMPLGYAQTSPPRHPAPAVSGLHVLSTVLNPQTHQIEIQLHNSSNKTVVAHVLLVKSYDRDGNTLQQLGYGQDFIDRYGLNTADYIFPGRTGTTSLPADFKALTVEVSVLGVVYLDRTAEGTAVTVFDSRQKLADQAKQALVMMSSNPPTAQTVRELLDINSSVVNGALANNLHLGRIPDKQHPPARETFSQAEWERTKEALSQTAETYETLAQEATK